MNPVSLRARPSIACMVCAALAMSAAWSRPTLHTTVLPIYQVGNGAGVSLGHVVDASTAYNRLVAGGTFVATCAYPNMLPASGQRMVSKDNFGGGIVMHVTIPEVLPAIVPMPGFDSLTRGTTVQCTYTWTSRAVEGGFTIGAGGITYQSGNGEATEGLFKAFTMSVPGDTNTDDFQSCIP